MNRKYYVLLALLIGMVSYEIWINVSIEQEVSVQCKNPQLIANIVIEGNLIYLTDDKAVITEEPMEIFGYTMRISEKTWIQWEIPLVNCVEINGTNIFTRMFTKDMCNNDCSLVEKAVVLSYKNQWFVIGYDSDHYAITRAISKPKISINTFYRYEGINCKWNDKVVKAYLNSEFGGYITGEFTVCVIIDEVEWVYTLDQTITKEMKEKIYFVNLDLEYMELVISDITDLFKRVKLEKIETKNCLINIKRI